MFRLLTLAVALLAAAPSLRAQETRERERARDRDRDRVCTCVFSGDEERDPDRDCRCRGFTFVGPGDFLFWRQVRLGISVDPEQPARYDEQGARVDDVLDDSPAEEAGLREDDIIVAIDGHRLTEPLDDDIEEDLDPDESLPTQRLLALARELEPGERVEIRYLRDGEEHTVEVEADDVEPGTIWGFGTDEKSMREALERSSEAMRRSRELLERRLIEPERVRVGPSGVTVFAGADRCPGGAPAWYGSDERGCVAGVELRELNPRLGEYFGTDHGVLVIDVSEDSTLGLMPGDVVLAVDGREVNILSRLRRILNSYEDDEEVTLRVLRKGTETTVTGTVR